MRVGLLLSNFSGAAGGRALADVGARCEEAGFDRLFLCDHFWWDPPPLAEGSTDRPMLEPFGALGLMAGATAEIGLGVMAAAAHVRPPALLAKQATTLDVLSGGRAVLGVGAGWFEAECAGLGVPFPTVAARFERLEETLRYLLASWAPGADRYDQAKPFEGPTVNAERVLCSPAPVQRPHPPLLVAGNGVRRTLPLAARYGDGCNLMAEVAAGSDWLSPLAGLLDRLRDCCQTEGRDDRAVERTVTLALPPVLDRAGTTAAWRAVDFAGLAALGFDEVVVCDSTEPDQSLFAWPGWVDLWAEELVPLCRGLDGGGGR